ncbi:ArdC-like ssDNA-binding domain-containing protein [Micromonospora sp. NPDC005171]|uniref:ArdC-like ssDNA-binding domain-containing protein n=1 Tax=Micromonospora sp. NPDC005171 TaxID=3156866 RepID=UPI0033A86E20
MATRKTPARKARANSTTTHHSNTRTTSETSPDNNDSDRDGLLAKIKADFDDRLARMAADPARWIEFIDHVAVFGARYSVGNQILLLVQAEERGITPRYFLPYGKKDGSTGWKAHHRYVRAGEKAFKIWAPITRRPTEDQATEWEANGRTVRREPSGRPAVQLVGFGLANTFELSQTDGEPFDPPTVLVRRRLHQHGNDPQLLVGDDPTGVYDDLVTLITDEGYDYQLVAPHTGHLNGANGVTVRGPDTRIVQVREDVDPAQRTKTTLHELAHIRCGHLDATAPGGTLHRGRTETEAESVTHIVLRALGMDSAAFSDAYVFGWANGDMDLVKECAATVLRVARQVLADLTPDESDDAAGPSAPGPDAPDPVVLALADLQAVGREVA